MVAYDATTLTVMKITAAISIKINVNAKNKYKPIVKHNNVSTEISDNNILTRITVSLGFCCYICCSPPLQKVEQ